MASQRSPQDDDHSARMSGARERAESVVQVERRGSSTPFSHPVSPPPAISAPPTHTSEQGAALQMLLPALIEVLRHLEAHLSTLLGMMAARTAAADTKRVVRLRSDLVFDEDRSELRLDGPKGVRTELLTAQERAVLIHLLTAPEHWFAHEVLIAHLNRLALLSAQTQDPSRTIMNVMSQLRMKTHDHRHTLIRLNRRVGYGIFPLTGQP